VESLIDAATWLIINHVFFVSQKQLHTLAGGLTPKSALPLEVRALQVSWTPQVYLANDI